VQKLLKKLPSVIAIFVAVTLSLGIVTPALAATRAAAVTPLTISQSGPNTAIDQNVSVTASEWTLKTNATPVANSDGTPANVSLVFEYTDAENYYYANFSSADATYLSGIYKVSNGIPTKLLGYANRVNAGQSYTMEVRKKSGEVKLYLNTTYLVKVSDTNAAAAKVGFGTVGSNASFDTMSLKTAVTTTLNPTPVVTTLPPPVTDPDHSLPTPSNPTMTPSTGRQVAVSNSAELKTAIQNALPGDTITMADGTYASSMLVGNYTGSFAMTADGTESNPITLKGSRNAIIDGNGTGGRYGLYLYGADFWNLDGFTVNNASKGIVLDGSSHVFLNNMKVSNVGQEAVHFRAFSRYNVIRDSEITGTGKKSAQYGEGVYIGSANSNWGTYTGGQPDTSDRNIVINNTFTNFTAEGIDLKEGSTGGYVAGNTFEGSAISGQNSADSWIDAKGNYYLIENNVGTNTLVDGFQVHSVYAGWGANNAFKANTANVNASGYGFNIVSTAMQFGNIVYCSNTATGAGLGLANVACTQD
jgi:parallel beta helix pectate lyase-like protein